MTRKLKEIVNQDAVRDTFHLGASDTHVAILLGLCNGAAMLGDQLESLAGQNHDDWSLFVSDDGSTDAWRDQIARFTCRHPGRGVTLMNGPRLGFAQNFLALLQAAGPTVPFAAFCDQDDVWRAEKLSVALCALGRVPEGVPAIYCGRTELTNAELRPTGYSPMFRKTPSFRNALVQSIAGGNTMVLNRPAIDLLQDTHQHAKGIVAHDWWTYQLVTGAGGVVIYDPEPRVLYRQHADNEIGSNAGWTASVRRLSMVFGGRFRAWNRANTAALALCSHQLTADALACLSQFEVAQNGGMVARIKALWQSGLVRQTRRGTLALWLAVVCKKL